MNVMFWSEDESQYVMYARCMVRNDGELIDTDPTPALGTAWA